jgi:hypothetical protein
MPPNEVLIATYCQVAAPVDRIVLDAGLRAMFMGQLPTMYRTTDPEAIAQRLVYLRKRGRLPRLFRQPARDRS